MTADEHADPPRATTRWLPDGATDPRAGQTALVIALGGTVCPVPLLMSVAAVRIVTAAPPERRSRAGRVALVVARVTIVVQLLAAVAFVIWLVG